MWSYSTNFMGPISNQWYEENNIPYTEETSYSFLLQKEISIKHYEQYAGGRIDCECDCETDVDYDRYGVELHLPIMKVESFNRLSEWLLLYTSETLDRDVLNTYEKMSAGKLNYFEISNI